jgi:aspartate carbamoyltransferase catalytic subunit
MSNQFDCLRQFQGVSICSATQFNREQAEALLELASLMKQLDEAQNPSPKQQQQQQNKQHQLPRLNSILNGKILVPLFFENSTRTFSSFCAAMQKLGGSVSYLPLEGSSMSKGETLEDTIRTVDCYADAICLRHPNQDALAKACSVAEHPIMNCGNGIGEHPSQSLLDIFTMKQELGRLDGLTIALLGDLKHGRTVHSLAKLLTLFKIEKLFLISPEALPMPTDVVDFLKSKNVNFELASSPSDEILKQLDVLYVTRIQKERFANVADYEAIRGSYIINKAMLDRACGTVCECVDCKCGSGCKCGTSTKKMIVMHPLPRVDEISTDLDKDPRAAYFRQMKCGLYLRMALFVVCFGKIDVLFGK